MRAKEITLADAMEQDILHRGDIILSIPNKPEWIQRQIVAFQRDRERIPEPFCLATHAIGVTGGRDWRGWEMAPGNRRESFIAEQYSDCRLLVLRFHGWASDEQRHRYCELLAALSQVKYGYSGLLRFYLGQFLPVVPGSRFCSQLIEDAAERVAVRNGTGFVDQSGADCTPARFGVSPVLEWLWIVNVPPRNDTNS